MADERDDWLHMLGVSISDWFGGDADGEQPVASATAASPVAASDRGKAHVAATFISQGSDPVGCKRAATAMAKTAGANPSAAKVGLKIATASDAKGHIEVNPEALAEGRKYIDDQLDSNKPVVVGVSHSQKAGENTNPDGITDHYVLITGRDIDEKTGRVYYTFKDPGTNREHGDDTPENVQNRFYPDASGKLVRPGNAGAFDEKGNDVPTVKRNYEVSLVVANASIEKGIDTPGTPANADIEAVRAALRKAGQTPAEEGKPWSGADKAALTAFQKAAGLLDEKGGSKEADTIYPGRIYPGG